MKNGIGWFIWVFVLALTACRATQTEPDGPVQSDQGEASFCSTVSGIPEAECEALVSFYDSTRGADWRLKRGWLDTAQPCDWAGLTCANGHVMAITIMTMTSGAASRPSWAICPGWRYWSSISII